MYPHEIVAGGISGLSQLTNAVFGWNITIFVFVCNLLILAWFTIGPKFVYKSILGGNIYFPFFLYVIPVTNVSEDMFLNVVAGGILLGLVLPFYFIQVEVAVELAH